MGNFVNKKANRSNGQQVLTLLDCLPTELIVLIVSFTPAQDRLRLRLASRRLQSVIDSPSVWSQFVWPYYHPSDSDQVKHLLRKYGQHVKRLSFPNRVTDEILSGISNSCSNVLQLSLPANKLSPKLLRNFLRQMRQLQKLDVKWDMNIKHILELIVVNLKELTVRLQLSIDDLMFEKSSLSWVHYWLLRRFVPQKITVVISSDYDSRIYGRAVYSSWVALNDQSPPGFTGHVKIYNNLRVPLDISPALPVFQIDFGQTAVSPIVSAQSMGLQGIQPTDYLLTSCTHNGKMVHNATMVRDESFNGAAKNVNHGIASFQFVTKFFACVGGSFNSFSSGRFDSFCSEHLEQLAIACPNLQRLSLLHNENCLKNLQGLRTIANSCQKLTRT